MLGVNANSSWWCRRFVVRLYFHTRVSILESEPEDFTCYVPRKIRRESFIIFDVKWCRDNGGNKDMSRWDQSILYLALWAEIPYNGYPVLVTKKTKLLGTSTQRNRPVAFGQSNVGVIPFDFCL